MALGPHDAKLVLHAEDRAQDIGVESRGIGLGRLVGDRTRLAFGAGRVDGGVDAAEPFDGCVDQAADLIVGTDVGLDKGGLGAEAGQIIRQGMTLVGIAAGDDDAIAGASEGDSGGATDAGQGAGDQDNRCRHFLNPLKKRLLLT